MPKTITLKKIHDSMDVTSPHAFPRQRERLNDLLPEMYATLTNARGGDGIAQINYLFNATPDKKTGELHSNAAYVRCADFILNLDNGPEYKAVFKTLKKKGLVADDADEADKTRLREMLNPLKLRQLVRIIAGRWQIENSADRRQALRNLINEDEDKELLSRQLREWLDEATQLRDDKLFRMVLAVLTILAVTRGVDSDGQHCWQKISAKLFECLPTVRTYTALKEYTDYCLEERWSEAQNELKDRLATNNGQRAELFRQMGDFFFKNFIYKIHSYSNSTDGFKDHIVWLYQKGLPTNAEASALIETWAETHYINGIVFFAALDCYRAAQACLSKNDTESISQWKRVSEEYLRHVIVSYKRNSDSASLTHFKHSAKVSAIQEYKEWYSDALLRIATEIFLAKAVAEVDDSDAAENFIEYLERARSLHDSDAARSLALRALAPLAKDPHKKFFESLYADLSPEQIAEQARELADQLTDSSDVRIRAAANWRLYMTIKAKLDKSVSVTDDEKNKMLQCLKRAYRGGWSDAVREFETDVVSYCEALQPDESQERATCLLNVAEHPIANIFKATCPKTFEILHATSQASVRDIISKFNGDRLITLLVDDNSEKNIADFLYVLEAVKDRRPSPNATISIFVRASANVETQIVIDTALQQYYNRYADDSSRPVLRVEILDEQKEAAVDLIANHPLVWPWWHKKADDDPRPLNFVIMGDGELAKHLVREAAAVLVFPKELKLEAKITLLIPFGGRSLRDELRAENPELADKIKEVYDVLLPGFPVPSKPPKSVKTLTKAIDDIDNGDDLYFAVAMSRGYNLDNLKAAILIRQTLLRVWIQSESSESTPNEVPISFYCPNPDIAFLAARSVVLGEEYGSMRTAWNSWNLVPFGSRLMYSYKSLVQSLYSRLGLAVHLNYCSVTKTALEGEPNSERERICLKNYIGYAKKTYNRQSSIAVATSIAYRLFIYEQLFGKKIFDADWDIQDPFFTEGNLSALASRMDISEDDPQDRLELTYRWEHDRWCARLQYAEDWKSASIKEVARYIRVGNHRQQAFAAAVHPCLAPYEELGNLATQISQLLRDNGVVLKKDKDFLSADWNSILGTREILQESVLRDSGLLKRLFLTD